MIRAVRLAATLDFAIEPATLAAIAAQAELVAPPVGRADRGRAREAPRRADPVGRVAPARGDRPPARHRARSSPTSAASPRTRSPGEDLWDHTVRTVDAAPRDRPIVRLAALVHDIGKPATFADGRFIGHETVGADLAEALLGPAPLPAGDDRAGRPPGPATTCSRTSLPPATRRSAGSSRRSASPRSTSCSRCAGPTISGAARPRCGRAGRAPGPGRRAAGGRGRARPGRPGGRRRRPDRRARRGSRSAARRGPRAAARGGRRRSRAERPPDAPAPRPGRARRRRLTPVRRGRASSAAREGATGLGALHDNEPAEQRRMPCGSWSPAGRATSARSASSGWSTPATTSWSSTTCRPVTAPPRARRRLVRRRLRSIARSSRRCWTGSGSRRSSTARHGRSSPSRSPIRRSTTATTSPAGSRCSRRPGPAGSGGSCSRRRAAVYGIPAATPINEDARLEPINPYGETKRTFETALGWYGRAYGTAERLAALLQRGRGVGPERRAPRPRDPPRSRTSCWRSRPAGP